MSSQSNDPLLQSTGRDVHPTVDIDPLFPPDPLPDEPLESYLDRILPQTLPPNVVRIAQVARDDSDSDSSSEQTTGGTHQKSYLTLLGTPTDNYIASLGHANENDADDGDDGDADAFVVGGDSRSLLWTLGARLDARPRQNWHVVAIPEASVARSNAPRWPTWADQQQQAARAAAADNTEALEKEERGTVVSTASRQQQVPPSLTSEKMPSAPPPTHTTGTAAGDDDAQQQAPPPTSQKMPPSPPTHTNGTAAGNDDTQPRPAKRRRLAPRQEQPQQPPPQPPQKPLPQPPAFPSTEREAALVRSFEAFQRRQEANAATIAADAVMGDYAGTGLCRWCGREGHEAVDCVRMDATHHDKAVCVACNNARHAVDQCDKFARGSMTWREQAALLVGRGAGRPGVRSYFYPWTAYLPPSSCPPPGSTPITRARLKEAVRRQPELLTRWRLWDYTQDTPPYEPLECQGEAAGDEALDEAFEEPLLF